MLLPAFFHGFYLLSAVLAVDTRSESKVFTTDAVGGPHGDGVSTGSALSAHALT